MMNVVVLNADFTYLNLVSWKRAFKLIDKGKVEVVKYSGDIARNSEGTFTFKIPKVVKLLNFVKQIYKAKVPFNKKNLVIRDGGQCQYCGITESKMTIDHVIPLSRGGTNGWHNCVCSCKKCNHRKGSQTLKESGMKLCKEPREPNISQFLAIKLKMTGLEKIIFGS